MSVFISPASVIITCNRRLSPFLLKEVEALGFMPDAVFQTGIRLIATLNDCIRLNLSLRCASQVLYSLNSFPASDADALYQELVKYPWEQILP